VRYRRWTATKHWSYRHWHHPRLQRELSFCGLMLDVRSLNSVTLGRGATPAAAAWPRRPCPGGSAVIVPSRARIETGSSTKYERFTSATPSQIFGSAPYVSLARTHGKGSPARRGALC